MADVDPIAEAQAAANEVGEFCRQCDDVSWHRVRTLEEGWPIAAVIAHIIDGGQLLIEWAAEMASGRDIEVTMPEVDRWNAESVAVWSRLERLSVESTMASAVQRLSSLLQNLTTDQLRSEHAWRITDRPRSAERLAIAFSSHARLHLQHARDAMARQQAAPQG